MHQIVCGLGLSAPPNTLAEFQGPTSKGQGKDERGREGGEGREERGGNGKEEREKRGRGGMKREGAGSAPKLTLGPQNYFPGAGAGSGTKNQPFFDHPSPKFQFSSRPYNCSGFTTKQHIIVTNRPTASASEPTYECTLKLSKANIIALSPCISTGTVQN